MIMVLCKELAYIHETLKKNGYEVSITLPRVLEININPQVSIEIIYGMEKRKYYTTIYTRNQTNDIIFVSSNEFYSDWGVLAQFTLTRL